MPDILSDTAVTKLSFSDKDGALQQPRRHILRIPLTGITSSIELTFNDYLLKGCGIKAQSF
jgi:hypothetical protein